MRKITHLRELLFEQIERLSKANPEELDYELNKAAGVVQVSDAIIRVGDLENRFIELTKRGDSGFIPTIDSGIIQFDSVIENSKDQCEDPAEEKFDTNSKNNWLIDDGKCPS